MLTACPASRGQIADALRAAKSSRRRQKAPAASRHDAVDGDRAALFHDLRAVEPNDPEQSASCRSIAEWRLRFKVLARTVCGPSVSVSAMAMALRPLQPLDGPIPDGRPRSLTDDGSHPQRHWGGSTNSYMVLSRTSTGRWRRPAWTVGFSGLRCRLRPAPRTASYGLEPASRWDGIAADIPLTCRSRRQRRPTVGLRSRGT